MPRRHFRVNPCFIAVLWVLICRVHFTVCSYHVTYAFQSESTLYSWLNFKELLAWRRLVIWSLTDCNETRTHNHLVRKRTTNHLARLAKWLSCVGSTYLFGAFDCMFCHALYAFQSESTSQSLKSERKWETRNTRMDKSEENRLLYKPMYTLHPHRYKNIYKYRYIHSHIHNMYY